MDVTEAYVINEPWNEALEREEREKGKKEEKSG